MLIKITLGFVVAAIAFASPPAASHRGGGSMQLAQYCAPQEDLPGAETVYC